MSRSDLETEIQQIMDYELVSGSEWCTSAEEMPASNQDEVRAKFQRVWDAYLDSEILSNYDEDAYVEAHVVQMVLLYQFYGTELTQAQQDWGMYLKWVYYDDFELPPGCAWDW
jgi:hypothetical protein